VRLGESRKVIGGVEVAAVHVLLNLVLLNVVDIGFPGIQHLDFLGIGVKTGYFVPGFRESERQGKPDVTASDDCDPELCTFEEFRPSVRWHVKEIAPQSWWRWHLSPS